MSYYSTEIERLSEICEKNRKIGWGSEQSEGPKSKLGRTTMMVLAVTLHNIPEGKAFLGGVLSGVVEELIPEMSQGEHSNIGTVFFAVGFSLMMVLDVALG